MSAVPLRLGTLVNDLLSAPDRIRSLARSSQVFTSAPSYAGGHSREATAAAAAAAHNAA